MSHPNPQHDRDNEYPEDKVSHYPKKKRAAKPHHALGNHFLAKARALRKKLENR